MKTILAIFLAVLLLLPVSALGEIQTITHIVKQPFGGSQSADDARIAAIAKAKREALEMAGVYIEALTIVKDAKVDKDEILALTAGVLKSEVISQKNYVSGDGFGIEVVVKIIVDPSVLEGRVKKLLRDRTHLEQLNQARKKEKELLDKMAILEKENRRLMAEKGSSKDLKKQFEETSQGITAIEWYKMYLALRGYYTVARAKTAVEYLNQAIRLKPDFAEAYKGRAVAYAILGQYQKELDDVNEAIRLKPDDADAYFNRGSAYSSLGQYQKAITDYNEAISRLAPEREEEKAFCYFSKGGIYNDLSQYKNAIEDYNEAIRLMPDYAPAYTGRAFAYNKLGHYQKAIEDCNIAIQIDPNNDRAYFNRGTAYGKIGQNQKELDDYSQAIRLKPDDPRNYIIRGTTYLQKNFTLSGCRDLQKACELGKCEAYDAVKNMGSCR